jgi:hypothetical protein
VGFATGRETAGFYGRPSSSFGYWRGTATDPGIAGAGGAASMPQTTSSGGLLGGIFSQGEGPPGASGWNPTIVYLLVLIVAEMFVFGFLARMLR